MRIEPSSDTALDAAAASAAANVLMVIIPNTNIKATLTEYLAKIPWQSREGQSHQAG